MSDVCSCKHELHDDPVIWWPACQECADMINRYLKRESDERKEGKTV